MPGIARIVSNVGVGSAEGSLYNLSTTVAAVLARGFTQTDLDNDRNAFGIYGNNVGALNTTTFGLFGAVLGLSAEKWVKTTTGKVKKIAVQLAGVATLGGTTTLPVLTTPAVLVQRGGKVCTTSLTTMESIGRPSRGLAINIWDTDRVDVLF